MTPDEKSKTLLDLILHELAEDKAEDVVTIDLGGKSEIADAMVIASGRSQRHVSAIADKVSRRLKAAKAKNVRCEGQPACDWVLIDAGDVILHLFRPEVRAFYNLERIWSETAHAASGPTT
ncbi:MAG: ribosome silencing factor [Pseudomonadota bacterium]